MTNVGGDEKMGFFFVLLKRREGALGRKGGKRGVGGLLSKGGGKKVFNRGKKISDKIRIGHFWHFPLFPLMPLPH